MSRNRTLLVDTGEGSATKSGLIAIKDYKDLIKHIRELNIAPENLSLYRVDILYDIVREAFGSAVAIEDTKLCVIGAAMLRQVIDEQITKHLKQAEK